ncbi:tumor protein p53-inducible nuclear protein 2 isoform X2 [Takifugu rubripes]|uniref:tumor protein p53-inducible nuclear protein 2 isoform X2 n=1 Tax=Takifugu rubripes TaxID=31033 RepID=UPI001145DFFC|nr:tumor protein p53-inducible nuclear protein 2 isoform X2 [Takifugu rubripes]
MFQRLTNLLFGEVEEVAAEIKGAKPCMTEADEEGWMIVNLPGDSDPVMEDETGTRPNAQTNQSNCSTQGAPAETSPMEDLLIEHPSMSVYVSSNNFSMVSNSNLSVVGEESIVSLASSMSRVAEPAALPSSLGTVPTRVSRGAAAQAGALAKVTQVSRVQRSKARIERRHLSRNRIQRQNLTREQVPRHAAHARKSFLHQPSKRNFCH